MHRIDSDGATIDNMFTEGDPSLSIPATVVSAAFMNAVQEEISGVIEDAGLTLLDSGTDTFDQLLEALKVLISTGGSIAPISQALANNSLAQDVTDFPFFDSTEKAALQFFYSIERRTDTQSVIETGTGYITWDNENSQYEVSGLTVHGDADTYFTIAASGGPATEYKLQYNTGDLTGASYSGTLRISNIQEIRL